MEAIHYLHLTPGDAPPVLDDCAPFKAVIVAESDVAPEWREQISTWLVKNSCLYAMTWGRSCASWEDCIDFAREAGFIGEIPDDQFVMTTSHPADTLASTFWFASHCALHPTRELANTVILHVSDRSAATTMLHAFHAAQENDNGEDS